MVERSKILVINDEHSASLLEIGLSQHFGIVTASDGAAGLALAFEQCPDLVIAEFAAPGIDGPGICRKLRENSLTRGTLIFIISQDNSEKNRIESYQAEVDDFVAKPITNEELLARIRARMRRHTEKSKPKSEINCGNLKVDMHKLEATIAGKRIPLSVLELSLLKFFIENKDHVLSREKIIASVWRDPSVSERAIDTHVVTLRKKLAEFDHHIRTLYGSGYILEKNSGVENIK